MKMMALPGKKSTHCKSGVQSRIRIGADCRVNLSPSPKAIQGIEETLRGFSVAKKRGGKKTQHPPGHMKQTNPNKMTWVNGLRYNPLRPFGLSKIWTEPPSLVSKLDDFSTSAIGVTPDRRRRQGSRL